MIDIVSQTIKYYFQYFKEPSVEDLSITDKSTLEHNGCVFITLYKNGEVRWSAGNMKEIEKNIVWELIKNTLHALTKDSRFEPVKMDEVKDLKIRIDLIRERHILKEGEIHSIDPVKSGIICIKRDYEKLAVILPNINPRLLTWEDFFPYLEAKLDEKEIKESDYILYSFTTTMVSNF